MIRNFLILLWLTSCTSTVVQEVPPEMFIDTKHPDLRNANGTWLLKGQKFSGYLIEKEGDQLLARMPVAEGKENGTAYGWYPNGKKRYERNFLNGNREGSHQGWHENDSLAFAFFFHEDKYEGEQRTYFKNGKPWQILNYIKGYEEGKQKSWNDSGRVINNFTVKNGKLYGVIGRYDCMSAVEK